MGFDHGTITFRVYRLPEAMPADTLERFQANCATSLEGVTDEPQWGWTTARHLLDTRITEESVKLGAYYHLCLRQAVRKIPSSLLQAECRVQEYSRMETEGREYLNKKEKRAIKEEVKERLLPTMPPQISGIYLVIDNGERLMFTTATSEHAMDVLEAMFTKTIGFTPVRLLADTTAEDLRIDPNSIPSFCISPNLKENNGEGNGTLGENFLTWLWYYQELRGGVFSQGTLGEFGLLLDGPLTFVSEDSGAFESVVRKGTPTISAEAKASLLVGKKLKSAKLIVARDQMEWSCQVDADAFVFRSLKLPEGEAMDPIAVFEERMTMLTMFYRVFFGLYQAFLEEMADAAKAKAYAKKARDWVANREER